MTQIKRWGPLLALAGLMALAFSQGWHNYLSLQTVSDNRDALQAFVADGLIVALLVYSAIYIVAVALSLPGGAVLTIVGGFLFGPWLGGSVTVVAATIGAVAVFAIARTSLGEPLAARAGPWLDKLRDGFTRNAMSYLLFLRLVPVFPFWLVNLAPAFLGVPLPTYVIGTLVGIIPGTFAFGFIGAGLDSIIEAQRLSYEACLADGGTDCKLTLDVGALVTPELLMALGGLGVVALIPVALERWRARKGF